MFQLTHMMTWTTISPVLALSYFSRLYPPHPLTQQFAVRVLRSYSSVSIRKFPPIIRIPCFFPWPSCPPPPPNFCVLTGCCCYHPLPPPLPRCLCFVRMCWFMHTMIISFLFCLCVCVFRMCCCSTYPDYSLCFFRMCCCSTHPGYSLFFFSGCAAVLHTLVILCLFFFSGGAAVLHTLVILCVFFSRMCCCSTHTVLHTLLFF